MDLALGFLRHVFLASRITEDLCGDLCHCHLFQMTLHIVAILWLIFFSCQDRGGYSKETVTTVSGEEFRN